MPNDELIDLVLSRSASATPSERLVLKLAASLLKQIDPDCDLFEHTDVRVQLSTEEAGWLPRRYEIFNSIARLKDFDISELVEAAERDNAAVEQIMKQSGVDYYGAWDEYEKRRKKK